MKLFARSALCAVFLTAIAVSASAQQTVQTCGGLLCDMGMFGHKVQAGPNGEAPTEAQIAAAEANDPHRLPCNDFLCRAFGQKSAEPAPPPPPVAAAEPEPAKPTKVAHKKKKKHIAKAEPAAAGGAQ